MYELTIYETIHRERISRVEAYANERDALTLLRPVGRAGLARVRTMLASLLPRAEQPRRHARMAS